MSDQARSRKERRENPDAHDQWEMAKEWLNAKHRKILGPFYRMSAAEITEACDHWAMFWGFSGEECHHCHETINLMMPSPGFLCDRCGSFNAVSWSHSRPIHRMPTFGPRAASIHKGFSKSKKWQNLLGREKEPWYKPFVDFMNSVPKV